MNLAEPVTVVETPLGWDHSVMLGRPDNEMAEYFMQKGLHVTKLLRNDGFIGGKWLNSISGKTYNITNPADNSEIGSIADMNTDDTLNAIDSAYVAQQTWRKTTGKERSTLLRKWFDLIQEHSRDLSIILTAESGKPLSESAGELAYGSGFVEWYAEESKRIMGEIATSPAANKQLFFYREPLGVVGLITPWNFPNAMITRKACAALASGCACVIKPAENTPLSALALAYLAEQAGIPSGVLNVVTSSRANAASIGQTLCSNDKIRGISFTGSTVVGKKLYAQCAGTVKKLSLELGGNAPFIIFDSAKVPLAVQGLMAAKFRNAGQACISANRVYVQSKIYDEFVEKLLVEVGKLKVGNGFEEGVNIGPLINQSQMDKVSRIVRESVEMGAKVLLGGNPHTNGSLFFQPTVLTDCHSDMSCVQEEIFGPIIAIQRFETEDEVLQKANDCKLGLASYFYSQDVSQVLRVSKALETGIVGVNEGLISAAEGAFGGVKESGLGREGSRHGMEDYTEIKYVCIGNIE